MTKSKFLTELINVRLFLFWVSNHHATSYLITLQRISLYLPQFFLSVTFYKPSCPSVGWLVGRLDCRSVSLSKSPKKGGSLHSHATVGVLFHLSIFLYTYISLTCMYVCPIVCLHTHTHTSC